MDDRRLIPFDFTEQEKDLILDSLVRYDDYLLDMDLPGNPDSFEIERDRKYIADICGKMPDNTAVFDTVEIQFIHAVLRDRKSNLDKALASGGVWDRVQLVSLAKSINRTMRTVDAILRSSFPLLS